MLSSNSMSPIALRVIFSISAATSPTSIPHASQSDSIAFVRGFLQADHISSVISLRGELMSKGPTAASPGTRGTKKDNLNNISYTLAEIALKLRERIATLSLSLLLGGLLRAIGTPNPFPLNSCAS